jgi:activator of HSP90 ATPase
MERRSIVTEVRMRTILTRRRAIAGIATSIGIFTAVGRAQESSPPAKAKDMRTSLHYDLEFAAPPQRVYNAILDQKQFAAFTGLPATIDPAPGGAFSLFREMITGRNIELIANQRIVQAWRPGHWEPGVYSMIHFELKPSAAGTAMAFDHTGCPAGEHDSLDSGWQSHYWGPLKKFLA